MTVFTGLRRNAGTTSNIYFVLDGSDDDSKTRSLYGGAREVGQNKCLKKESTNPQLILLYEKKRIYLVQFRV